MKKEEFTEQIKQELKGVILPTEVGDEEYKRVTDYLITIGFFNRFCYIDKDCKLNSDCKCEDCKEYTRNFSPKI